MAKAALEYVHVIDKKTRKSIHCVGPTNSPERVARGMSILTLSPAGTSGINAADPPFSVEEASIIATVSVGSAAAVHDWSSVGLLADVPQEFASEHNRLW